MARITSLSDTPMDIIIKLADGNVGVVTVMSEMFKQGATIDPDSALGGLGAILALDTHKIYGSRIWMLFKDVCGQDLRVTLAILRAVQLGLLSESELNYAIDHSRRKRDGEGLDVRMFVEQVEKQLPNFQKAPLDNCEVCKGAKGGVRGNENIVDGKVMCDYCTVEHRKAVTAEVPMQSHVDYLNSQDSDDNDLSTAIGVAAVAEVVSDVFSSVSNDPTPDPAPDFSGFDGGDSGGGGASGEY